MSGQIFFHLSTLYTSIHISFQIPLLEKSVPKEYIAELWARNGETITFSVEFYTGSHMNVSWQLETEENSCSCKFPFQSEGYFYYGCNQENKCAASIDNSFKPIGDLIDCEEKCHKQSE